MATNPKGKNTDVELGELVSRSEQFIERYRSHIIYSLTAIALVVGAILAIRYGYLIPHEKQAAAILFKGEQYFAKDSFALALYGNDADYPGFEDIVSNYGGTRSGNLAKAYAGICYFKLGDNDNALRLLKSFHAKDQMIAPAVTGLIGDCYVNAGKIEEGIRYFQKAARQADNEVISPLYLKKAGIAYESLQQYDRAIKAYTTIKTNYHNSAEASDIDKYITRATELAKTQ